MDAQDVVIIGGGQAGLAMGHHLARRGLRFVILDAAPSIGHAWRTRWDSLRLFTPARYSGLPGLPFPGDPEHYPARDEVAAYLQAYARTFALPVRLGERVTELTADPDGAGLQVRTAAGTLRADQVVVATGPFQRPAVPPLAAQLPPGIAQLHSSEYRNPAQLPAGEVLVVGAGNSGVQIAEELAASRPVSLAVGEALARVPQTVLGRRIFWWLERSGALRVPGDSLLGRRMWERELLIGSSPAMVARSAGVRLLDRIVAVDGGRLRSARGETSEPAAVVWATGYRSDFSWLRLPVLGPEGRPLHRRGVAPVPGVYFLGQPWQHTRGSALIGWVGGDAAVLADRIVAERPRGSSALSPRGSRVGGAMG